MWNRARAQAEPAAPCQHLSTKRGSLAGLERILCESCGHVSVRYVEDVIFDDIVIPGEPDFNARLAQPTTA